MIDAKTISSYSRRRNTTCHTFMILVKCHCFSSCKKAIDRICLPIQYKTNEVRSLWWGLCKNYDSCKLSFFFMWGDVRELNTKCKKFQKKLQLPIELWSLRQCYGYKYAPHFLETCQPFIFNNKLGSEMKIVEKINST